MDESASPRASVLLMGPPNVGKSVLFNHFTGMEVSCANYIGTTVEYSTGEFRGMSRDTLLIDVPGTYTLEASNEAEEVAVRMLANPPSSRDEIRHSSSHCEPTSKHDPSKPSAVLCVLDAVNLESSLYLLSYILDYRLPVVAALNRIDIAKKKGIHVSHEKLSHILGIPVVPTIAPTGAGTEELKQQLEKLLSAGGQAETARHQSTDPLQRWKRVEDIAARVQHREKQPEHRSTFDELLIRPWPGLPIAVLILLGSFGLVVGLGMGLRQFLLLPLFRGYVFPLIISGVESLLQPGMLQRILIGEYGFLIKGIEWPFTLVFPYVLSFYLAMAVLEDSGYLPRLGALLDGLFNRLGMSGGSIIPLLLGYGCAIPAIMATRALHTRKERLIAVSIICLTIPCISQTGAIITLLAEHSAAVVFGLAVFSLIAVASTGLLLEKLLHGPLPAMVIELPELLPPRPSVLGKKLAIRSKRFISDGAVPMIGAVGLASVLYESGLMTAAGRVLSPLVTLWLRLPEEAAVPLILGIMRRELSILPLLEMDLTALQLFTGALVGLFYVPCIAVVVSIAREFKLTTALLILLTTSTTAFLVGGIVAQIGGLLI